MFNFWPFTLGWHQTQRSAPQPSLPASAPTQQVHRDANAALGTTLCPQPGQFVNRERFAKMSEADFIALARMQRSGMI
jgi:hypothetical protein